jgi:hypothetical protein
LVDKRCLLFLSLLQLQLRLSAGSANSSDVKGVAGYVQAASTLGCSFRSKDQQTFGLIVAEVGLQAVFASTIREAPGEFWFAREFPWSIIKGNGQGRLR